MVQRRDFTDRFLRAIKPAPLGKRIIIYDGIVPGFGIRVNDQSRPEAIGAFVLVARFPGSPNPAPRRIGDYPTTTLANARDIAREWREDLRHGVDPKVKQAERRREEDRRRADTFGALLEAFAEDHLSTLRTGTEVKKALVRHVLPRWADRPISELRRADVNELVRTIRKDAPISANRVLAYLKKLFAWAVGQDLLEASPAAHVERPARENQRDRVLSDAEIRAIWLACDGLGVFGKAFQLMLLSGQRRSEVGGMTWSELNLKSATWTLARERTKADRSHSIPLSKSAIDIIESCPRLSPFVFSTGRAESAISGWSKAKKQLDQKVAQGDTKVGDWHLHDLRRTFGTHLAKLGTDRIVISKILNHAEGGVTNIYDRHRYDDKKRFALERWSERLNQIVEDDNESSNVVPLDAARR